MLKLEELKPHAVIKGILPSSAVTVVSVTWYGSDALELTYSKFRTALSIGGIEAK